MPTVHTPAKAAIVAGAIVRAGLAAQSLAGDVTFDQVDGKLRAQWQGHAFIAATGSLDHVDVKAFAGAAVDYFLAQAT